MPSLQSRLTPATAVPAIPSAIFPSRIISHLYETCIPLFLRAARVHPDAHMLRGILDAYKKRVSSFGERANGCGNIEFIFFRSREERIHNFHGDGDVHVMALFAGFPHVHHQVSVRFRHANVLTVLLHGYEFVVRGRADGVKDGAQVHAVHIFTGNGDAPLMQVSSVDRREYFFRDGERQIYVHTLAFRWIIYLDVQVVVLLRSHSHCGHCQCESAKQRQISHSLWHRWEASSALPACSYGESRGKVPLLLEIRSSTALELEVDGSQRGQSEFQRVGAVVPRHRLGPDAAGIAFAGAFVMVGVGIEDFAIKAGFGDADAVIFADYRREIADCDNEILGISSAAYEGQNTGGRVIGFDPFEARPFEVHFMERPLAGMKKIQASYEPLDAPVWW